MKPLHILLVGKNSPAFFEREHRNMGMFSYEVPEFTWTHCTPDKGAILDKTALSKEYDLIFHEDSGWCEYTGSGLPVIFYAIDSTLTRENHWQPRFEQSKAADLCLVDHDRLQRFSYGSRPVKRLLYCVNDRLFYDRGLVRDLDVVYHCPGGNYVPGKEERRAIRQLLHEYCQEHGLTYVSGAVGIQEYAEHFARAKVVVSWSRTEINRPHRVYDSMASGACLVSRTLPSIKGENWIPGLYYAPFQDHDQLGRILDVFFQDVYSWETMAELGHQEVIQHHTWAHRAKELRQMIVEEFKL